MLEGCLRIHQIYLEKIKISENETFTEPLSIFTMMSKYEMESILVSSCRLIEGRGNRLFQTLG